MKKVFLFSVALAALMLGSCSSSEDLNGGSTGKNEGKTSYIAINLNNVGNAPTSRAGEYQQGDGTYEDGTDSESGVKKVRFYFFDEKGEPYPLKDQNANYIESTPDMTGGANHDQTIEQISKSVLIIDGENDEDPSTVVAVINPQTLAPELSVGSLSLSALRKQLAKTYFTTENTEFVMSNSVYENSSNTEFCETALTGHIASSAEAAEKTPVDIYVERVAAKVTADVSKNNDWTLDTTNKYRHSVGSFTDGNGTKYDVYAVVEGWGLADESTTAPLFKNKLDASWTDTTLGIAPWTTEDYHRSFWELNLANTNDNPLKNQAFNAYTTEFGSTHPIYTLPNTPETKLATSDDALYNNSLTKILVAAKLVYKDGNDYKPAEICTYKGVKYLGETSVLTVIANEFKDQLFTKPTQDGRDVYMGITPADLEFDAQSTAGVKEYQVVAKLKEGTTYYKKSGTAYVEATDDDKKVVSLEPADVRKEGMAYYYTTIHHLGSNGTLGEYGVVRNHVYKITIGNIAGFGTPVYDPTKVIDPQLPSDSKSYLAARINVLSWRVVTSTVDLDKTNK